MRNYGRRPHNRGYSPKPSYDRKPSYDGKQDGYGKEVHDDYKDVKDPYEHTDDYVDVKVYDYDYKPDNGY